MRQVCFDARAEGRVADSPSTPLGYVQVGDDEVGQIEDRSGGCRWVPVDEHERRFAVSRDEEVVPLHVVVDQRPRQDLFSNRK
jgi:hypothetical protein